MRYSLQRSLCAKYSTLNPKYHRVDHINALTLGYGFCTLSGMSLLLGNIKFASYYNTFWIFLQEGSSYNSNSLMHLRADCGSTWDGKINIKNTRACVFTNDDVCLVMHSYKNWYFGYQSCFPSLEIEKLDFFDSKTGEPLSEGYKIKLCKTSVTAAEDMYIRYLERTDLECATEDIMTKRKATAAFLETLNL